MGKSILDTVVQLLNDGGVSAAPAQPEENMYIIHTPVAAVSLEKVDRINGSATVLVEVVAPMKSGGKSCQTRALKVCELLTNAGAQCVQGNCIFISKAALFRVQVTALFYGTALAEDWIPRPAAIVIFADAALQYVRSFSAEQRVDETNLSLADAVWEFTLEEFIPVGVEEPQQLQEPFSVQLCVGETTETFSGCTLTQQQRICSAEGTRQIRKGKATARTVE